MHFFFWQVWIFFNAGQQPNIWKKENEEKKLGEKSTQNNVLEMIGSPLLISSGYFLVEHYLKKRVKFLQDFVLETYSNILKCIEQRYANIYNTYYIYKVHIYIHFCCLIVIFSKSKKKTYKTIRQKKENRKKMWQLTTQIKSASIVGWKKKQNKQKNNKNETYYSWYTWIHIFHCSYLFVNNLWFFFLEYK